VIGAFRVVAVATILGSVVLFQLFADRLPHASVRFVVDTIRSELPRADAVDWALYFALSGMRGVKNSELCTSSSAKSPSGMRNDVSLFG
jgi:hypothetical protein